MARVLGIVEIIWLGRNIPVEKGAKLRLGGIKNNAVTFGRKVRPAGEYQGSEITAKTHLETGESWRDKYSDVDTGELQVKCDTKQSYIWADAFFEGDIPTITGGAGGEIELKWAAGDWEEVIT